MGTFAETANFDNRLSFADQGIHTVLPFSICRKQTKVRRFRFRFAARIFI
jgi:hypothetical protein